MKKTLDNNKKLFLLNLPCKIPCPIDLRSSGIRCEK